MNTRPTVQTPSDPRILRRTTAVGALAVALGVGLVAGCATTASTPRPTHTIAAAAPGGHPHQHPLRTPEAHTPTTAPTTAPRSTTQAPTPRHTTPQVQTPRSTTTQTPTPRRTTPQVQTPPAQTPQAHAPQHSAAKQIALTFDDGPGPYTEKLLGILRAKNVHATFFLIGQQVAGHAQEVRDEVHDGNVVGDHTWDHPLLTRLSTNAIGSEVDRTAAAIKKASGVSVQLVRPPYGSTNSTVRATLAARGLSQILWNVDTEDWKNRNVQVTTQRALAGARPGAIILMHDIHPTTVQAVPGIIDALRHRGYTLVTVPQLLGSHLTPGAAYFGR